MTVTDRVMRPAGIAVLCMILLIPLTIAPIEGQVDRRQELHFKYITLVLNPGSPDITYLYSVNMGSLTNIIDVAYAKMNECYDHNQYGCALLKAKWLVAKSVYSHKSEDHVMRIMDYLNQMSAAHELCRVDGNTEYNCSSIDATQQYFREFLTPDYNREMWTHVTFIDGYGPSYKITWTDKAAHVGQAYGSILAGTCLSKSNQEPCDPPDSKDIPPMSRTLDFSKQSLTIRALETMLHDKINAYRIENSIQPLTFDDDLALVARLHSEEQVSFRYLSHDNRAKEGPTERGENLGYECFKEYDEYYYYGLGENVLYDYIYKFTRTDDSIPNSSWKTPLEIVDGMFQGWKESPGHNENMLDTSYDKGGIGIAINEKAEIVATHNFC